MAAQVRSTQRFPVLDRFEWHSRDVAVERLAAGHREAVDALKSVGCTDTA